MEEFITCQICNNRLKRLSKHIKIHNMTMQQYRERFPGAPIIAESLLQYLSRPIFIKREEARIQKEQEESKRQKELEGKENYDYVICKECNTKCKEITQRHLKCKHNMTTEQYKNKYNVKQLKCQKLIDQKYHRKHTEEVKRQISETKIGHNVSEETKEKIKKTNLEKYGIEYGFMRKEARIKSVQNRFTKAKEKYDNYIDLLKKGETYSSIAQLTGDCAESVRMFFQKHYGSEGLSQRYGKCSLQEKKVGEFLKQIFSNVSCNGYYPKPLEKCNYDFHIDDLNKYIEYDGQGHWHFNRENDELKDKYFKPIRLNAQAYFGGVDYLNWKLLNKLIGYCSIQDLREYKVKQVKSKDTHYILEQCHVLGNAAGKINFGLYYKDKIIGVAKFGMPTYKGDNGKLELRRFFILDGTPRNTESYFLRQCEKMLPKGTQIVTFTHNEEQGSYLKALNYKEIFYKGEMQEYDIYIVNGKKFSRRTFWYHAKELGLVDKLGTDKAKQFLARAIGAKIQIEKPKRRFEKILI